MEKELYTVTKASKELSVSRQTVYSYIDKLDDTKKIKYTQTNDRGNIVINQEGIEYFRRLREVNLEYLGQSPRKEDVKVESSVDKDKTELESYLQQIDKLKKENETLRQERETSFKEYANTLNEKDKRVDELVDKLTTLAETMANISAEQSRMNIQIEGFKAVRDNVDKSVKGVSSVDDNGSQGVVEEVNNPKKGIFNRLFGK